MFSADGEKGGGGGQEVVWSAFRLPPSAFLLDELACKLGGGVLGFIGFMLSPLSWWNDLFVNVPLAVAAAWLVALLYPPAFKPVVVAAYWLTNVLGFVLLHKGGQLLLVKGEIKPYRRRDLLRDLAVSLAYTLLIVLLLRLKLPQPVTDYFGSR